MNVLAIAASRNGRFRRIAASLAIAAACTQAVAAADAPVANALSDLHGPPGGREPLRLDGYGAVAFALHNAPALLSQTATILANDLTYTRDRAAEFPGLSGELQNQISKQSNQIGSFAQFGLSPQNNFSENVAQLAASYNLYNGGAQLTAQQAKRFTEASKYELKRQQEQVAIAVSNNFYELAADHRVVLLDENDVRYQRALLDAARASERVGRVAGVDVLRAEVAAARRPRASPRR